MPVVVVVDSLRTAVHPHRSEPLGLLAGELSQRDGAFPIRQTRGIPDTLSQDSSHYHQLIEQSKVPVGASITSNPKYPPSLQDDPPQTHPQPSSFPNPRSAQPLLQCLISRMTRPRAVNSHLKRWFNALSPKQLLPFASHASSKKP
jgi:hypothetical protein